MVGQHGVEGYYVGIIDGQVRPVGKLVEIEEWHCIPTEVREIGL